MIETTYVRLAQAAQMLSTDADTLLIAAAEGRIRLYWLLNAVIGAEYGAYEETGMPAEEGPKHLWATYGGEIRHFTFVPLSSTNAAALLKRPTAEWDEYLLTIPEADGAYWIVANERWGVKHTDADWKLITREALFMALEDVHLAACVVPKPGSVKDAQIPASRTPRDSSLVTTIAALLALWPGGAIPSGKDLEKAAQSLGLTISDDTIRKALSAAQEAAPSLPLPK